MNGYISREGLKQAMLKRGFFPAIVAGALDAQPAEKIVAVDGELGLILNFAVRYACGRMTYAQMAVINFITPLIPHLDDRTLALLDKDLEDAQYNGGYGDPKVDEPRWKEFHALVRQERRRRVGIWDQLERE